MEKISITEKLRTFDKYWQSKLVGDFNSQPVKLAKIKGDFDWHSHSNEDEFYLVLKGQLNIEMKNKSLSLDEGELFIIQRKTPHRISASQEVHILTIEPKSTNNVDETSSASSK